MDKLEGMVEMNVLNGKKGVKEWRKRIKEKAASYFPGGGGGEGT